MKRATFALVAVMLASCGEAPPKDCDTALRQLEKCLAKHADNSGREQLLACIPFSAVERIEGTWATDFEFNEFFEGERLTPEEVWRSRQRSTRLNADTPMRKNRSGPPQAVVSYIVVEGRRDLCQLPDSSTIVAERIISESLIEARPSEWYAAPP